LDDEESLELLVGQKGMVGGKKREEKQRGKGMWQGKSIHRGPRQTFRFEESLKDVNQPAGTDEREERRKRGEKSQVRGGR